MNLTNHVTLIGNLGKDPELRHTASGTPVCNLSLAVDRTFIATNPDGSKERKKTADWIPVTCWGPQAENAATWLKTGSQIGVDAELRQRSYEDDKGTKHYTLEVRATNIEFLNNIRSREEVQAMRTSTVVESQHSV